MMKYSLRLGIVFMFMMLCSVATLAQDGDDVSDAFVTNSFKDNIYGRIGVDMSLQNPYGCNFANVFPNGKSYGIDFSVGKLFTPEVGGRVKLNLENIFLQSDHAEWTKSFDKGFISVLGDIPLDVQSLFGDYKPDRFWTFTVYPRVGGIINFNSGKGSPVLGFGIGNTFRLNEKWSLYADVAYQVMTNVVGYKTDTGSGSNGYFDINIGVQYNFKKRDFHKASDNVEHDKHAVALNGFWDNWFVQAGVGMSLLNVYDTNFGDVFPNGKTLGINLGVGKWITPGFGIRGGLNWQNGIVGNNHLGWLDKDGPGSNHKAGGYIAAYVDPIFNLHHLFGAYDENRFWNSMFFFRAGLDSNLEGKTGSPLLGLGFEQTFKLNKRLHLYFDVAYQVTSTEFMNDMTEHKTSGSSSNGWFDLNIGIQYDLGKNYWKKVK